MLRFLRFLLILSRKYGIDVDIPAYQVWKDGLRAALRDPPDTRTVATAGPDAPAYPMSFNRIVELISTGQPIPGIKEIPNTILEGEASHLKAATRRKPWEKPVTAEIEVSGTSERNLERNL